jgi:hypothetical protein
MFYKPGWLKIFEEFMYSILGKEIAETNSKSYADDLTTIRSIELAYKQAQYEAENKR